VRLCLSLAVSIATSTQIASCALHHEETIVNGEEMVLHNSDTHTLVGYGRV